MWLETLIKSLTPSLLKASSQKSAYSRVLLPCSRSLLTLVLVSPQGDGRQSMPSALHRLVCNCREVPAQLVQGGPREVAQATALATGVVCMCSQCVPNVFLMCCALLLQHLEALFASVCHHLEEASGVEQKAGKRSKTMEGGGGEVCDEGSSAVLARAVSEALVVLDVLQAHEDPAHALALMPNLFKLLAAINVSRLAVADDGDESLVQVCTGFKRDLLCKQKSPIMQAKEPYYDVDDGDESLLQSLLGAIQCVL